MTDFATSFRAKLISDPEAAASWRGRRILSIIDAPESDWRTRHLQRWQDRTIGHAKSHGYQGDLTNINWDTFWTWLSRAATLLSFLLMLLPFMGEDSRESGDVLP